MITLKQTVIVEGKYDKIKLSNFIASDIMTTDGFRIFKDIKKRELVRRIADSKGIIILTDSDSAGFIIRGHLSGIVDNENIINMYVPEIKGKERRKTKCSAEGFLGVEGLSEEIIIEALIRAGVDIGNGESKRKDGEKITRTDLYELGLFGAESSGAKRKSLEEKLGFPKGMSVSQLISALNSLYTKDEFLRCFEQE